jgi:hypothetical protein
MKCIYCLKDSSTSVGRAHVVPEAVGRNNLVLPVGAVCDSCNQYLGRLDSTLAKHPLVSLGAQLLRIHGKGGKVRRVIGTVAQEESEHAVSIPVKAESVQTRDGTEWRVTPLVDRDFRDYEFRRALHHVALNTIAYRDGAGYACEPVFDAVRRYIRQPRKKERWGFGQLPLFDQLSPNIKLLRQAAGNALFVGMRLYAVVFWVDLLGSDALPSFVEKEQRSHPDLRYFGPAEGIPSEMIWDGENDYRVFIDLD